jgi:hypothetical protein
VRAGGGQVGEVLQEPSRLPELLAEADLDLT